jgi:recombination protein RecR
MTNSDFLPTAEPVARLIQEFHKLPGVGSKTAQRLTYHLVRMPKAESENLAEAILAMKDRTILCSKCQNISENDPCPICLDPERDITRICILEEPLDVLAIERTHAYKGLYHVLHGAISPINGTGPDELRISELLTRIKEGNVTEVIVATNPNLEGEATAMYLHKLISHLVEKVTRLARGLPIGGDLEYADQITLTRAFEGRQEF